MDLWKFMSTPSQCKPWLDLVRYVMHGLSGIVAAIKFHSLSQPSLLFINSGNNPGGFSGPPVTIEWVAQSKIKIPVGTYEDDRPPRRSGSQMNIPRSAREEMLRDAGYSRGEILEALRDVNIARQKRRRTIDTMNLSPMHEFRERLVRGSLNLTLNRGRKARERKYLEEAWEVHRQMEKLEVECDESVDGSAHEEEVN